MFSKAVAISPELARAQQLGHPLPQGWTEKFYHAGRKYYEYNSTQWEHPGSPLPQGWAEKFDQNRQKYYYEYSSTQWEHPGGETSGATTSSQYSLPQGWAEKFDQNGKKYYDYTRTQCEHPGHPLPQGWTEKFDQSGKKYYEYGYTQWEHPGGKIQGHGSDATTSVASEGSYSPPTTYGNYGLGDDTITSFASMSLSSPPTTYGSSTSMDTAWHSMRLKIVSEDKIASKEKKLQLTSDFEVGANENYTVSGMVRLAVKKVTYDVHNCIFAFIKPRHGKVASSGHFYPSKINIASKDIAKAFSEDAKKMAGSDEPLDGLILGGERNSDRNTSRRLYEKIKSDIVSAGVQEPSEIFGRKEPVGQTSYSLAAEGKTEYPPPCMRVVYDGSKKTVYVSMHSIWGDLLSLKAIAYWFEKFHLASTCNLKINGTTYSPEEVNNIVEQYHATFQAAFDDDVIPLAELNQAL